MNWDVKWTREAVTNHMLKVIYERLSAIDGEFDADFERQRLHQLHANDYAYSIYASASLWGASSALKLRELQ